MGESYKEGVAMGEKSVASVFLTISEVDVMKGGTITREHCICTCIVFPILYGED